MRYAVKPIMRKNYPTKRKTYNHVNGLWSVDLMNMSDYDISIKK